MLKTLERYQKCNYGAPEPNISAREALSFGSFEELSSQQEYLKLKARFEALQRTQRNLLGEDLGPLNSKELESLERQLDMSLKQIRSTRKQKDVLAPEKQEVGNNVMWTSGIIFGRGEGIVGLETEYGTLNIKLLPECSPHSVAYILELLSLRHCAGCQFYRAEGRGQSWDINGNHIQGTIDAIFFNDSMQEMINISCKDMITKYADTTNPRIIPQHLKSAVDKSRRLHLTLKNDGKIVVNNVSNNTSDTITQSRAGTSTFTPTTPLPKAATSKRPLDETPEKLVDGGRLRQRRERRSRSVGLRRAAIWGSSTWFGLTLVRAGNGLSD
ncbi:hypothetical protein CASFOL_025472 [Castilleja foliolosa]|uniref:K-box domain-containing protein n=1 Tax=Castilleja foliolosa TaxID=1961234 RepID=A0ABD3CR77_9LAMI